MHDGLWYGITVRMQHFDQNKEDFVYPVYLFPRGFKYFHLPRKQKVAKSDYK